MAALEGVAGSLSAGERVTGSPFLDGVLCTLGVLPLLLWLGWATVVGLAITGHLRGGWGP